MDSFSPASSLPPSHFKKTVCLLDWWLIKSDVEHQGRRIAIGGSEFKEPAGSRIRNREPGRYFCSAPIVKRYSRFALETADGILVRLCGYINKRMTEQKGFSSEVFHYFVIGFPTNWEECAEECLEKGPAVEDSAPELTNVKHMGNLTSSSKEDCSSAEDIRQGIMYDGHVYSDSNSALQDKGVHENIFSFNHWMPSPVASLACSNMPNVNDNSLGAPLLRQSGKDACNLTGERLVVMESHIQDVASEGKNFRSNSINDGKERIPDVAHHAALANLETSFDDTTQSKESAEIIVFPDAYQPAENLTTDIGGHNPKKLKPRKSDGNSMSLSSKKHNSNASVILPDDDKKMLQRCISEATDVAKGNRDSPMEIVRQATRASSRKGIFPQKDDNLIAAETVLSHSTHCSSRESTPRRKDACYLYDEGAAVTESQTLDVTSHGKKSSLVYGLESILEGNESIPNYSYRSGLASPHNDSNPSKDSVEEDVPDASGNLTTTYIGGRRSKQLKTKNSHGNPIPLSSTGSNNNISRVSPNGDKKLSHKHSSEATDVPNGNMDSSVEVLRRSTRSSTRKVSLSRKDGSNIAAETVLCHSTQCSLRKSKPSKKDNGSIGAKRENNAKDLETSQKDEKNIAAETVLRHSTRCSSKKSRPRKKDNGGIAAKRDRKNNAKDLDASRKHESNIAAETGCSSRKSKPRKKDSGSIAAKRDRENKAKDLEISKQVNRKLDFGSPVTPAQQRKKKATSAASEGLTFKRSRSGRLLLPQLEYWRNQIPAYNADHEISGIVDGTDMIPLPTGTRSEPPKRRRKKLG